MFRFFFLFLVSTGTLFAADPNFKKGYDFEKDIVPLLDKYCYRCHDEEVQKGDVELSSFRSPQSMLGERKMWVEALHLIKEGEMPSKKPFPEGKDLSLLENYIDSVVNGIDWTKVKNPGFEEPSRLNTRQYANSLRDLLGQDLPIEKYFLEDSLGKSGFSNDRGAAFFSSDRLKTNMKIAKKSLQNTLFRKEQPYSETFKAHDMGNGSNRTLEMEEGVGFTLEQMNLTQNIHIKSAGDYTLSVKSSAIWKDKRVAAPLLYIYIDGELYDSATIKGDEAVISDFDVFLEKGVRTIGFSAWKSSEAGLDDQEWKKKIQEHELKLKTKFGKEDLNKDGKHSLNERALAAKLDIRFKKQDKNSDGVLSLEEAFPKFDKKNEQRFRGMDFDRNKSLDSTEFYMRHLRVKRGKEHELLTYPLEDNFWKGHYGLNAGSIRGLKNGLCVQELKVEGPKFYKKPFDVSEKASQDTIEKFILKAFRRPATEVELSRYLSYYKKNKSTLGHDEALFNTLTGILVSPKFLCHFEKNTHDGKDYQLNDFELASRLSYFLWMSSPDEILLSLARKGHLSDEKVLDEQVERMLKDPRAKAFTHTFAEEWLGISELGVTILPVGFHYPKFNVEVIRSTKEQTRTFVHKVFSDNQPITDFVDSDYTYVNRVLGQFYGIENWIDLPPNNYVRVKVGRQRGGLLGQSSILTVTSAPTRTNPIVRGIWVLENIMGVDIPPPDPDAGAISENAGNSGKMTLREIFEEHRKNPNCASCHEKIDPVGFSMENYDGIGLWRENYKQGSAINASAVMPNGTKFSGALELRDLILSRQDEVTRNLTEKCLVLR